MNSDESETTGNLSDAGGGRPPGPPGPPDKERRGEKEKSTPMETGSSQDHSGTIC